MHAMEGQIEPKWWDMWPQDDRVAFLRDMAALQTRYEEVRLLHPGVDRMVRLDCSLFALFSQCLIEPLRLLTSRTRPPRPPRRRSFA